MDPQIGLLTYNIGSISNMTDRVIGDRRPSEDGGSIRSEEEAEGGRRDRRRRRAVHVDYQRPLPTDRGSVRPPEVVALLIIPRMREGAARTERGREGGWDICSIRMRVVHPAFRPFRQSIQAASSPLKVRGGLTGPCGSMWSPPSRNTLPLSSLNAALA